MNSAIHQDLRRWNQKCSDQSRFLVKGAGYSIGLEAAARSVSFILGSENPGYLTVHKMFNPFRLKNQAPYDTFKEPV